VQWSSSAPTELQRVPGCISLGVDRLPRSPSHPWDLLRLPVSGQ